MKAKALPSQERLKYLLDYDPETGLFTWTDNLAPGRIKSGDVAGSTASDGYVRIVIDNTSYSASRLAWLWMTGTDPSDLEVDHIDRTRSNNTWDNLHLVNHSGNINNRKAWGNGISQYGSNGKWRVRYAKQNLGTFATKEEALEARKSHLASINK